MKVYTAWLFFFLLILMPVEAQKNLSTKSNKAEKLYREAIVKLNKYDPESAAVLLNSAVDADKNFVEAYFLLGEIYNDLNQDSLAINALKNGVSIDPEVFPPALSNLARLEWNNGLYDDALLHIKQYLQLPNLRENSKVAAGYLVKSCEFAIKAVKNPVPFNPQNLGPAINNRYDQYWPSLSADEKTLITTVSVPINLNNPQVYMNRQEDFYISSFSDGNWSQSKAMPPPLNTSKNEGAQSISADGTVMVFTGCNRKDGMGLCDLYISKKTGDQWSVPRNMGEPVNTTYKETQPSISPDGKTIYFCSNRKESKGGLDLWKTTLSDSGYWNTPVNLGDSINTIFDEQSPFIHNDNRTLYFSSNGWPGLGSFDLFVSRRISDSTWTTPRNLGFPINSHFNEEGLIINAKGNTAYYSSTRAGGYGGRDIYSFELYKEAQPTPVSYMKGIVYDSETKAPLKARFELIDLNTANSIMDAFSNDDGTFLICIPTGKNYALNVNKKGYLFYSDNFTMGNGDFITPFTKDIPLEPVKAGNKIILKNIFFDYDSYKLKEESKIELVKLFMFLNDNKLIKIEISGHTDNTGLKDYNIKLSENRAQSVVKYLVDSGIDANRIVWKGYGDSRPITPNTTEEGRAANRRTEFTIMSTGENSK
jgi:outer membrane protein OmpA-like peptidoglycan-associated protein